MTGLPRSWKNPGILKFSGKVMEFRLKLTKVMEKSRNFEIRTQSHGILSWKCRGNPEIGLLH